MLGCLNCWNDLDIFKVRESFFTRLGIFPYHEKDAERIQDNIQSYCNEKNYKLSYDVDEVTHDGADALGAASSNAGKRGTTVVQTTADMRRTTGISGVNRIDTTLTAGQKKKTLTLEAYMQENFNPVQSSIISFFEPIAKQNPQQVVFGFLEIWKVSGNITQRGLNKNEACEKLI